MLLLTFSRRFNRSLAIARWISDPGRAGTVEKLVTEWLHLNPRPIRFLPGRSGFTSGRCKASFLLNFTFSVNALG